MAQVWHDLLFAHWPIAVDVMRAAVPAGLELDTYDGRAWLGVVPFRMSGVRLRCTPPLPRISAFPELNVRTYVRLDDRPGVYFFSLDARNPIAVSIARAWFHLPYFRARMSCEREGERIVYRHARTHSGARAGELRGSYGPHGPVFRATSGTLEHFLVERYCLYAAARSGDLFRADIHHPPWPLQLGEAAFDRNTIAAASGFDLPSSAPLLHFSRRQDVVVWNPRSVR